MVIIFSLSLKIHNVKNVLIAYRSCSLLKPMNISNANVSNAFGNFSKMFPVLLGNIEPN
jgi:hypothetical protein